MPLFWQAKAANEVITREWTIPVGEGDNVLSVTSSATDVTIDSTDRSGNVVTFTLSGGANDDTGVVALEAVTTDGLTYQETAYIPIRGTANAFGYNVGDVLAYALRPIVGIGRTATAAELEDAKENFNDMLAELRESGGDIGIKLPVDVSDTLYIADDFVSALKNGLRVRISALYGRPLDQMTVMAAQRGLQRIKAQLLPDDRKVTFF
jgi:hypothetical protein